MLLFLCCVSSSRLTRWKMAENQKTAADQWRRIWDTVCLPAPVHLPSSFFFFPSSSEVGWEVLWCASVYSTHAFWRWESWMRGFQCVWVCWHTRASLGCLRGHKDVQVCVCVHVHSFWGTLFRLVWLGVELIFVVLEVRAVCQQWGSREPGVSSVDSIFPHPLHPLHPALMEKRQICKYYTDTHIL